MSLSKYYEKSEAFKPEEIVKDAITTATSWKPVATNEKQPFTARNIAEKQADIKKPAKHPPLPEEKNEPAETPPPAAAETTAAEDEIPPAAETAPPPPPTPIDLSQYMEIAEAEKAIEEAYQKGLAEGQLKVEQDFADATRMLISASQQIDNIRETLINNSAREMQEFALAIAEKIVRISLSEQDSSLIETIEEAIQRAVKSDEFTVYVNPEDYDSAVEKSPDIVNGISGLNNLVVKKDATIEKGGAKLESDNCTIDATIASQLEIIREEVKKRL